MHGLSYWDYMVNHLCSCLSRSPSTSICPWSTLQGETQNTTSSSYSVHHCALLYAIFMKQKTQHINIETVITQFIFMMRLTKWIRLELWSLIHWFSYTACEMFSLTLFPAFPLRPAGPGNPRGPLKKNNKKQKERDDFKGYWMSIGNIKRKCPHRRPVLSTVPF